MSETCRIQWCDAKGNATPDNNIAVGRVRRPARVVQIAGRSVPVEASQWFPICADHAAQLQEPNILEQWEFEPLHPNATPGV